jgi:hypothetical protein
MIDIEFIQFYIKKRYYKSIEEYFGVTSAVASAWRRKSFPKNRLNEFIVNEKSFDIHELFEKIYKKE